MKDLGEERKGMMLCEVVSFSFFSWEMRVRDRLVCLDLWALRHATVRLSKKRDLKGRFESFEKNIFCHPKHCAEAGDYLSVCSEDNPPPLSAGEEVGKKNLH